MVRVYKKLKSKMKLCKQYINANRTSKAAFAVEHHISRSQLNNWLTFYQNKWLLLNNYEKKNIKNKLTVHSGPRSIINEYADLILDAHHTWRMCGVPVSYRMLTTIVRSISEYYNIRPYSHCYRAIMRFCSSSGLVQRRGTHIAQHCIENLQVCKSFVRMFKDMKRCFDVSDDCIINIDETNVYYNQVKETTLEAAGVRTVRIQSDRNDNRCTAILAVTCNGAKLKPMIIFKGTENGTISRSFTIGNGYDENLVYATQSNAWCDQRIMQMWIQQVLKPYVESKNKMCILIMDVFSAHTTEAVLLELGNIGVNVLLVPPHHTWILQPLDVGINKPFKDYIHILRENRYVAAYHAANHNLLTNNDVNRTQIAAWIASAWNNVTIENITNTWNKIINNENFN